MIDWNDHPYGHGVVGSVYHKEQQSIFYAENNIVFDILSRKRELKKKRFLHTEGGLLICSHGKLFSSAYTGRPFSFLQTQGDLLVDSWGDLFHF